MLGFGWGSVFCISGRFLVDAAVAAAAGAQRVLHSIARVSMGDHTLAYLCSFFPAVVKKCKMTMVALDWWVILEPLILTHLIALRTLFLSLHLHYFHPRWLVCGGQWPDSICRCFLLHMAWSHPVSDLEISFPRNRTS